MAEALAMILNFRDPVQQQWRVTRARAYELQNKQSGHGLAIDLGPGSGGGLFWSHGWQACPFGCGRRMDDYSAPLFYFERRAGGYVTKGWCCRPSALE